MFSYFPQALTLCHQYRKDRQVIQGSDTVTAYYDKGVEHYEAGRYIEAAEAFRQVLRLRPDMAEAHNNLGVAYNALGLHEEGVKCSEQAIRLKPDSAEAHRNLGWAKHKLGRHGEAVDAFKRAIQFRPNYVLVFNGRGRLTSRAPVATNFNAICAAQRKSGQRLTPCPLRPM